MTNLPVSAQPSLASLVKALAIASAIAVALAVLVVLPAERNIDITGFGNAIGLTALSAPLSAGSTQTPTMEPGAGGAPTNDRTVVDVPPGKGLEYKFYIRAGAKLEYEWELDTGEVFYDFHGEPKGAAADVFESFASGNASGVKGKLTAPFEGTHGWYWKNRGTESVKITLVTSGTYDVLGLK
ncbi:MAG: hypothetical protein HZA52_14265 [Planctomycetes bacterium]|nr:hypothetical protein [Planctomycetota bacterium]